MKNDQSASASRPGYLYRHWSETGNLLYIGISLNAVARLAQHRDKPWFSRIAKITVERFDTYEEAEIAELKAICYEGPIHNIKGPRDAKDLGPALTRLRAALRRAAKSERSKTSRIRDAYEVDRAFGVVPETMTFEEYAGRPDIYMQTLTPIRLHGGR